MKWVKKFVGEIGETGGLWFYNDQIMLKQVHNRYWGGLGKCVEQRFGLELRLGIVGGYVDWWPLSEIGANIFGENWGKYWVRVFEVDQVN